MTTDLTKLKANSADIKGWTEALQRVADWDFFGSGGHTTPH